VAGVSIGSLYQYFPNKDALIELVRAGQEGAFRDKLEPRFESLVELPLREAVRGVVSLLIDYHRESRGIHNALQEPAQPDFHEDLHDMSLRSPELLDDPEYASELVEMLVGYLER
jgi:AcrR family transcriptional regulator